MQLPDASKPTLFALLLAWPVAAVLGLALAHLTQTKWPAGVLPAAGSSC